MAQYELIIKVDKATKKADKNLAGENKKSNEEKEAEKLAKKQERMGKAVAAWAINTTKSLVISKVGEFTRDNVLQRKINAAMDIADTAIFFSINPVMGTINLAVKLASSAIDKNIAVSKQENRLNVLGERAGYINRSRD